MLNLDKYKTKEDCQRDIDLLESMGVTPPPELLKKLKAFEDAENSTTPIWDTLKLHYPFGVMPEEKVKCVEETVTKLMETGPHAEEPGLLLGKIQCGKTDTFEDIIGLAFDKGIDIAIVLTKGTKALVNQTIKRMKKDFKYFVDTDSLDQRTTIKIYDIMDKGRNLTPAKVEGCKTAIVCKKNSANLAHLIDLFEKKSPSLKSKKVLIVDDEADFASRNYRTVKQQGKVDTDGKPLSQISESELAKIAQQIDNFREIPEFCRYLQVTATPYCLYLQPNGELNLNGNIVKPFRPRFTSLVPIHEKYIGGQQYFVESQYHESMYSHLFHPVSDKCANVLGYEDMRLLEDNIASQNLYGLTYTLISYFMATAVRRIQVAKYENKNYNTSAILHADIAKADHDWQSRVVERLIEAIKVAINDASQSDQRVWATIDIIYDDFAESNRKGRAAGLISVELPSKDDVMSGFRSLINGNYHIQKVNSDEQTNSLLDENTGELELVSPATIFIGGNILDRGVTIKNLLCFFYGRNPKTFQQDTVLQHARMYGARSKEDMAVMRFHTTEALYNTMRRMNEIDDQLRQWFTEAEGNENPNATFVGFDKEYHIKPTAPTKIKISNTLTLKRQQRFVPAGFWTGSQNEIGKTVEKIDNLITKSADYENKDSDGFFTMDKDTVVEILRLIESTYVYDDEHGNRNRKSDIKELLCALEYCTKKSGNMIYALHRTGREMSRIRENGCFIDAPDDGHSDTKPARERAISTPVIMFFRQNGSKNIESLTGENKGWNDAPFYWPVLLTQYYIPTVMFALDQKEKKEVYIQDISALLDGVDREEVLSLTLKGPLERFGKEGDEYTEEEGFPIETRTITAHTAHRYILKGEDGTWMKNPDVPFDNNHDHGVYSYNNGEFPFVLKPYKYMLLRNGRDARADAILMELLPPEEWEVEPIFNYDDKGNLIDFFTEQVLCPLTDVILDKNMDGKDFTEETIVQWLITYSIKRVIKFQKHVSLDERFAPSDANDANDDNSEN
ncbi:MAG: Z1 domain-containing protein [Bacteroidales bacterium]|nr:Z1 domain-containing protein [Bacteroidales bacterium]